MIMTKKIIELYQVKENFIREMEMAVERETVEKIEERLSSQLQQIRSECLSKFPDSFGRFYENFEDELKFEAYNLKKRSLKNTIENIKSDISQTAYELLEDAKQDNVINGSERIKSPDQKHKKINFERKTNIQNALKMAFKNGISSLGIISFTSSDAEDLLCVIKRYN